MNNTYKILLLKTETGETRWIERPYAWDEGQEYQWIDGGNYSCDCNRHAVFHGEDEVAAMMCGEVSYRALRVELPDGTLIELESY